jgi:hypothetical protein
MCLSVWRFLRGDPALLAARDDAEIGHGEPATPLGTTGP